VGEMARETETVTGVEEIGGGQTRSGGKTWRWSPQSPCAGLAESISCTLLRFSLSLLHSSARTGLE